MAHVQADIDSTVGSVILLWTVSQFDKLEGFLEEVGHFGREVVGILSVAGVEGVVVEGDAVDDGDEEKRPVGSTFSYVGIAAVVDGEEDVCYAV